MNRPFLLFLVAICAFLSVAADTDQNEVVKETAEGELKNSRNNLIDEEEDEEEENDEEEEEYLNDPEAKDLSANLPFHPARDVSNSWAQEFLVQSRSPSCSDRKCRRWYLGYWAALCTNANYPPVFYCAQTAKWCCAYCKPKKWCTANGGECLLNCPPGTKSYKKGCFGKWSCCIPING
ncbi:uncharacterized protein LOC135208868 isoform X1 [Macrobrachium nipponense]|uniref:uncharacterized protein LOC135208868 isoform X1 n=1 Tax=Macrobrachium nipponense TaxID=159736 RepID=UPI0030C7A2BE